MTPRLYAVKDSQDYFRAGISSVDGIQALFGRQASSLLCLKFSADGVLIGCESKPISDPDNDDATYEETERRMAHIGFSPGTIRIQEFALPDRSIEIKDLPDYLQEYLESPSNFTTSRQEHLSRRIEEWRQSGGYVLIWDEEYEMSADGEVEST
jgi:hypothetical protein